MTQDSRLHSAFLVQKAEEIIKYIEKINYNSEKHPR